MSEGAFENYWSLIESAFEQVNIYDGPDEFFRGFNSCPVHVQHLLAAHWCHSEICNGGLHQFFYNPTGVLAPEAVKGFGALGMTDAAAALTSAMARLGPTYPRDHDSRMTVVGESPKKGLNFDDLDKRMNAAFGDAKEQADGNWADSFDLAADAYARTFA